MVGNLLGTCEQCDGALCLRETQVCCIECGLPVPAHPRVLAAKKPAAVARPAVQAQQLAAVPSATPPVEQRKKR